MKVKCVGMVEIFKKLQSVEKAFLISVWGFIRKKLRKQWQNYKPKMWTFYYVFISNGRLY